MHVRDLVPEGVDLDDGLDGQSAALPAIFPDQFRRSCATTLVGRELVLARWGMPGPPEYGDQPVTNIRNMISLLWRGWLGSRNRVHRSRDIVLRTRRHRAAQDAYLVRALGRQAPLRLRPMDPLASV